MQVFQDHSQEMTEVYNLSLYFYQVSTKNRMFV